MVPKKYLVLPLCALAHTANLSCRQTKPKQSPSLEAIFTTIYHHPKWGGGSETKSGGGSTLAYTKNLCFILPTLFKDFKIKSIVDVPCGDFHWMSQVDLSEIDNYTGMDIVAPLIGDNKKKHMSEKRTFLQADATVTVPPQSDLILCRDLFIHLTLADIKRVLQNFKKSGSRYLLINTYMVGKNTNLSQGRNMYGRPVDLQAAPFHFPKPIKVIDEQQKWAKTIRKVLALWEIKDLPIK